MSLQDGQTSRTASGASRGRPQDQSEKISQIEKSVTHLLVATKQLLEILTAWSRREASEINVSDVYVRLGYEFNIACRAFNGIGVETQDLGPVPDLLRNILEDTLSNEPSQASLEQYLPRIRDIIVNLLQGLKRKQQRLRQRNGREPGSTSASESRQNSISSSFTTTSQIDDRQSGQSSVSQRSASGDSTVQNGTLPAFRMSSAPTASGRASPARLDSVPPQRAKSSSRSNAEYTATSVQPGKLPVNTIPQEIPLIQPGPFSLEKAFPQPPESTDPSPTSSEIAQPRPQPRQHDALAALQRGGELERRASRRFSAYQIQKHLGSNANGIPMIPPAQHSPIPNRGREREAMKADRMRGSPLASNNRSETVVLQPGSPTRQGTTQQPQSFNDPFVRTDIAAEKGPFDSDAVESPMVKTPEDKLRTSYIASTDEVPIVSASSANQSVNIPPTTPVHDGRISQGPWKRTSMIEAAIPPTSKELTLFLQYKTKIKKCTLPDGHEELSIARLQLAFMEKFAWDTNNNGLELPEIYIQDPASGVRYELEEMSDIKNNAVLVLNVDALDDVKRHVDDGMGSLKQMLDGVRSAVNEQKSVLQLITESQQDAVKSLAILKTSPTQQQIVVPSILINDTNLPKDTKARVSEVQNLRQDLATVRQTYTSLMSDMEASMTGLRAKASTIKVAAVMASLPTFEGSSGRGYVDAGKKTLSDDSEKIINRVDDLQDIVEDLRKDVVSRGVRPLPRQLETVSKEISTATAELKKLLEFIKREKPIWTKIWRNELEIVYDDQKNLNMQEELAADLEKDLTEAANTFGLVEEATRQQNLGNPQNTPTRTISRALTPANHDVNPQKAKDSVLGEVRALQPNHETRLEAIERAEKARQKELESRNEGAFKKELAGFVDEGRLKKSGGVQAADRLRKAKDDRIRKEVWERMNPGMTAPSSEGDTPGSAPEPMEEETSQTTSGVAPTGHDQGEPSDPASRHSVHEGSVEHRVGQSDKAPEPESEQEPTSTTTENDPTQPDPEPEFVVPAEKPADIDPNTAGSVQS